MLRDYEGELTTQRVNSLGARLRSPLPEQAVPT